MLCVCECWPAKKEDLRRLERNERSMLRWMCCIKPGVHTSLNDLCRNSGLVNLHTELRCRHLRWLSHVQCSSENIDTIRSLQVDGKKRGVAPGKLGRNWWKVT